MLLMIYLCKLWFTYDLLMIYLWNGEGGVLIILMEITIYLFHLWVLMFSYVTYSTYAEY